MREIVELKERIQDLEGQVQADYELIGSVRQQMEQVSVVIMTGDTAIIMYLMLQKTRELEHYKEVAEQVSGTILLCVLWRLLGLSKLRRMSYLRTSLNRANQGKVLKLN